MRTRDVAASRSRVSQVERLHRANASAGENLAGGLGVGGTNDEREGARSGAGAGRSIPNLRRNLIARRLGRVGVQTVDHDEARVSGEGVPQLASGRRGVGEQRNTDV